MSKRKEEYYYEPTEYVSDGLSSNVKKAIRRSVKTEQRLRKQYNLNNVKDLNNLQNVRNKLENNQFVALKIFKPGFTDSDAGFQHVDGERKILKYLSKDKNKHPNIVMLKDTLRDQKTKKMCGLVLEYVDGGELFDYLQFPNLPITFVKAVFQQLVRALSHLHCKGVVHLDVKPENILLSSSGIVKLTDFGYAQKVPKVRFDPLLSTSNSTIFTDISSVSNFSSAEKLMQWKKVKRNSFFMPTQADSNPGMAGQNSLNKDSTGTIAATTSGDGFLGLGSVINMIRSIPAAAVTKTKGDGEEKPRRLSNEKSALSQIPEDSISPDLAPYYPRSSIQKVFAPTDLGYEAILIKDFHSQSQTNASSMLKLYNTFTGIKSIGSKNIEHSSTQTPRSTTQDGSFSMAEERFEKTKSLTNLQPRVKKPQSRKKICPAPLLVTSIGGTVQYKAPESYIEMERKKKMKAAKNKSGQMMKDKKTYFDGAAADVWSLGVVLHVMIFGRFPNIKQLHESCFQKFKKTVQANGSLSNDDKIFNDAMDLLDNVLLPEPKKRWNIMQIGQHGFSDAEYFSNGSSIIREHIKKVTPLINAEKLRRLEMKKMEEYFEKQLQPKKQKTNASTIQNSENKTQEANVNSGFFAALFGWR